MTAVLAATLPDELIDPTGNNLVLKGSSTVYPVSSSAESAFEAATGKTVTIESIGSGPGLDALNESTTDVAAASKIAGAEYWDDPGLADYRIWIVGRDGVAIIVPASNTWLTDASTQTIANIFRAEEVTPNSAPYYEYWDEVPGLTGAPHELINRYCRKMNDGTHDGFNSFFMKNWGFNTGGTDGVTNWLPPHTTCETNQDMIASVAADANGIGYCGLGFLEENTQIKGVLINGVEPTIPHVLDGTYVEEKAGKSISRELWYVTNSVPHINSPGALKAQWISFVRSDVIFITDNGYIPVPRGDFTGGNASPDTVAPMHATLPDGKVNFSDLLYFVSGYVQIRQGADSKIDPYCDFDADGDIDFQDLLDFVSSYVISPH